MPTPDQNNRIVRIAQELLPCVNERTIDLFKSAQHCRNRLATKRQNARAEIKRLTGLNAPVVFIQPYQNLLSKIETDLHGGLLDEYEADLFQSIGERMGKTQKTVDVIKTYFTKTDAKEMLGSDVPPDIADQVVNNAIFTLRIDILKTIEPDTDDDDEGDYEYPEEVIFRAEYATEIAFKVAELLGIEIIFKGVTDTFDDDIEK